MKKKLLNFEKLSLLFQLTEISLLIVQNKLNRQSICLRFVAELCLKV
jgi:hypothetical protein